MNKKCFTYISDVTLLIAALVYLAQGDCLLPKQNLQHGRFLHRGTLSSDSPKSATENYFLRFKCNRGYVLKGSRAILCSDGKWTDKVPKCIKMTCGEPPTIEDGIYDLNTGTSDKSSIGSVAVYSCASGYELRNSTINTLTCTFNEDESSLEWKGEIPNCQQKKSCPDPGTSVDGKRIGDSLFVGDTLNYTCNDRFILVGKDSIQCLPGGDWSSSRPLCRPLSDHCEIPPQIPHGVAKGDKTGDFFLPYDEVEVLCELGYYYTGTSKYAECLEEGEWDEEFQECKEVFCDYPEPLANGTILDIKSINATTFPFNFELTYVCNKGFRLIGNSWRFCNTKGWSGKTPHCEVIRCPDPGVPQHGTRLSDSFEIGDKVIFKCFTGYDLIGSFERYCMPNGQWSGELARCDHANNYCADPGIPINGMKNSTDYGMGEKILFQCQPGYTLLGTGVRECLPERIWSGTEAKCLGPYDFDNSAKVSELLMAAIKEKENEQREKTKKYRDALYSSWHNGSMAAGRILNLNYPGRLILYFAFDVSGSVGLHNFRKSVEFAKAIVKRIGITEMGARAGALTFSSKAEVSFIPVTYTTTEDVLNALDKINYTGGGTSASSAFESILEMMVLTEAVLTKRGQKSIIFLLTDGKANMGGDPQQKAEVLKQAQVEIYCIGITSDVLQDSLYNIASENEAGSKDDHVFILENFPTLSWLVEKITNGTIDYSRCGLGLEKVGRESGRGRMVGGHEAPEAWPWMAALYFTNPDMELILQCGGSIINEKYILTAAHCLFKESGELRKEKEIIVKLGLTNVQNVTNMEEFEIINIFYHPKFKPGLIFDYDIALLELSRPIEFTALIRPICLPPAKLQPDSTFYKPGQYVVATGWGHPDIVQKIQKTNFKTVDDLKEIILPIQSDERCLQSAKEHIISNIPIEQQFTDRMFCIGDGNGGNDTCRGDSGGPLMQSQQDSEGNKYWTQIGIVSWGFGCGLPNTYGYYTHVQRLYSFIADTIGLPEVSFIEQINIFP